MGSTHTTWPSFPACRVRFKSQPAGESEVREVRLTTQRAMLARLLKEFDERILGDPSLDASVFSKLTSLQRELGLVFGDRPTCPFLRPHIIPRSQYDEV